MAKGLDDLLNDQSTQKDIEQALEKVCSIVPAQYKDECDSVVELYGPMIIQYLVSEFAPGKICKDLGLCLTAIKAKVCVTKVRWLTTVVLYRGGI